MRTLYEELTQRDRIMYFSQGGGGPIDLTIAYTATQFDFKWKAPATSSLIFSWGDGTTTTVSGQDSTEVTTSSNYSAAGTYTFNVFGDVTDLTYIDISNQTFVSGDVSAWSTLSNIAVILAEFTGVSGDISGWSVLTALSALDIYNTNVSGDISGFSALTLLTYFRAFNTSVSGDVSGFSTLINIGPIGLRLENTNVDFDSSPAWSISNTIIRFQDCAMTPTQVDNMIASFSTCTNSTLNVAGSNAHRTAASNDDLNTLIANGNTITLNDVLGDELHTSLNAANDSATEAITAFADYAATIDGGTQVTQGQDISNMLPLGNELLSAPALDSDDWDKDAGWTYDAGDDEYDCDGTNDADLAITEANDDGKYYLVTVTTNNYVAGDLKARYGQSDYYTFGFTGDETLSVIIRKEITDDELELRSVNYEGSISDVSLKEIEVLGSDLVTDGGFASACGVNWACGTAWSIGTGVASFDSSATSGLSQGSVFDTDSYYLLKFTVSNSTSYGMKILDSAGSIDYRIGSTAWEDYGNNTITMLLYIPSASNGTLAFYGQNAVGSFDLDNVSVHKLLVTKEIAASTAYTGTHYVLPEAGADLDSVIIPVSYVAESITAQKITGESNLTTDWTAANNAVLSSVSTPVNDGEFALSIESNTTPTADADSDISITVDNAAVYRLSVDHRHNGTGDDWILDVEGTTADTLDNTETTYATKIYYFTSGDTTCTITYKENNASNNGGVYVDNLSLKKVTFP